MMQWFHSLLAHGLKCLLHCVFTLDDEPGLDNSDIIENIEAAEEAGHGKARTDGGSADLEFTSSIILPVYFYSCSRSSITDELVNGTETNRKADEFLVGVASHCLSPVFLSSPLPFCYCVIDIPCRISGFRSWR